MTELGTDWTMVPFRKSSSSDVNGGNCVEVGGRSGVVGVRDSKNPVGGVLALPGQVWTTFVATLTR
ncbi:MAG TPA: DUF397 domain-containing protein [Actinokineospora sp.]|nr:DUF397 domain-containing protein [Actinokineospora sp.]